MDNRNHLRYMGVPVKGKTYMFGDNKSVVTNSTVPHSELKKRHVALSYHKTREAIAAGIVKFHHIAGALNPADLLSKHWGFAEGWPRLKPVLFWMGDTSVTGDGVAVKGQSASMSNDGEYYAKQAVLDPDPDLNLDLDPNCDLTKVRAPKAMSIDRD